MHALDTLNSLVVGSTVAVIGAGAIGLLAVQIAKELGAGFVALSGTRPERLAIGRAYGADRLIDVHTEDPVASVRDATNGIGVDIVLECSGATTSVDEALRMVRRGGDIVLVGFFGYPVTAELNLAVMNGVTIRTVRGEGRRLRAACRLARGTGSHQDVRTHHAPLPARRDRCGIRCLRGPPGGRDQGDDRHLSDPRQVSWRSVRPPESACRRRLAAIGNGYNA